MIHNGNSNEWSPIRSVIIQVTDKIERPLKRDRVRFVQSRGVYVRPNRTTWNSVINHWDRTAKKIVNIIDWSFIKIKQQDLPNSLYYFMRGLSHFFPVLESFKRINAVSSKIVCGWRINIFLWVLNSIDTTVVRKEKVKKMLTDTRKILDLSRLVW